MKLTENPLFFTDYYKVHHHKMYPAGTVKIYSNFTPRKSRLMNINKVVFFGLQYLLIEYFERAFNQEFFSKPKEEVIAEYKEFMDCTLGKDAVSVTHIEQLHDLGYLPLEIKALPEGTVFPIGVPCLTITNTVDHAYWLVNYLETLISNILWRPITAATTAFHYKELLTKWALKTGTPIEFVPWQMHDFSARGLPGIEAGVLSGLAHLTVATGSDTVWAIRAAKTYYGADYTKYLVGSSVPATEHSVMCMGGKENEIETFIELMEKYPTGLLSVVSDTWNLWEVCTKFLPKLKDKILARDGKLVIRPDSGTPEDIVCGTMPFWKDEYELALKKHWTNDATNTQKGVVELLWEVFGGTINEKGYKVLDSHIGVIYGDSITLERANEICRRLEAKGFASGNVVLGIGSYTYQYNTRDSLGMAMKATYGEVFTEAIPETARLSDEVVVDGKRGVIESKEIWKDPITDDGTKKSAKGLLRVDRSEQGTITMKDQCTWEDEKGGLLETVFLNGKIARVTTLQEIRDRLTKQLTNVESKTYETV